MGGGGGGLFLTLFKKSRYTQLIYSNNIYSNNTIEKIYLNDIFQAV